MNLPEPKKNRRTWPRRLAILLSLCVLVSASTAGFLIWWMGEARPPVRPVAAIVVLGAGIDGDRPSPVFEARIRHGIELYREGYAPLIVFTGGHGSKERRAEAEVARNYAISAGVPEAAILMETKSKTTLQNLEEAGRVLDAHGVDRQILIVSDPYHLLRAMWMAHRLGFAVFVSGTPYTEFRSWKTKGPFLLREIYFLHHYAVFRQ